MKNTSPSITAIDLGTSQCTTLIAVPNAETGDFRVVGFASIPSRGIKKSNIVDLEQAVNTIALSLERAERMAGLESQSAVLSISGTHISSQNLPGMIAISSPTQEVSAEDVERVIDAAKSVAIPADREVLYLMPRFFELDSQEGIKDPVGMVGLQLKSQVHMITGGSAQLRNLEKCMKDLGLGIDDFVFSGLAAAEVTLTETEKDLGAVAVNIGAGTTSYCVYVDGAIAYSGCLPIGAQHITQDIAVAYRISFDSAERIKISLRPEDFLDPVMRKDESKEEFKRRRRLDDALDPAMLRIPENIGSISKNYLLNTVIASRVKEIFRLLGDELESKKLLNQIPGGVVLSGGGALTIGIIDEASRILGLNARIGWPTNVRGVADNLEDPRFATILGLLKHVTTQQRKVLSVEQTTVVVKKNGIFVRLSELVKNFFP